MSAALYTVELNGEIIARRESLLWVRLDAPSLYIVCTEAEGEGVIVDGEIYHVRGVRFCRESRPLNSTISNDNGGMKWTVLARLSESSGLSSAAS